MPYIQYLRMVFDYKKNHITLPHYSISMHLVKRNLIESVDLIYIHVQIQNNSLNFASATAPINVDDSLKSCLRHSFYSFHSFNDLHATSINYRSISRKEKNVEPTFSIQTHFLPKARSQYDNTLQITFSARFT